MTVESEQAALVMRRGLKSDTAAYEDAVVGTGFVPIGSERVRDDSGIIRRRGDGMEVSIKARAIQEFIGTACFIFFATLITVNASEARGSAVAETSAMIGTWMVGDQGEVYLNRTSVVFLASQAASSIRSGVGQRSVMTNTETLFSIVNPVFTLVTSLGWASIYYLGLRALPGCTFNPWITLNGFFFQWKADGTSLGLTHWSHSIRETMSVVIAQFSAAICAIILVYFVQGADVNKLGNTLPTHKITNDSEVIAYEAMASFLFMSLINVYSRPRRGVTNSEQALFIGVIKFMLMMAFMDFTGCSLNFARTFAAALIRSMFGARSMPVSVLYYLIGQAIGFTAAGILAWSVNKEWGSRFHSINKMFVG